MHQYVIRYPLPVLMGCTQVDLGSDGILTAQQLC